MIALYARVSTADQAEHGFSIGEQTERLQKYCEAMGWPAYKTYIDPGFSGGSMNRPGLQAMIRDLKAGKIEKVVVYKLDRLSRSQLDTLYLIEEVFLANGSDFISLSENFDTGSPFGRAMIGILAVFAQLEREQIKERMAMGKVARAKQGRFPGCKIPIGYDYKNEKLIPNEFERLQISEIFDAYLSGIAPHKIAEDFTRKGYRHKYGQWNATTIRAVLKNKTYCGYTRFRKVYTKSDHEPIISEETYEKVQSMIERRYTQHVQNNSRPGKASSYLAGFLICGCCGAHFQKIKAYSIKKGKRYSYVYYACGSRAKKNKNVIKDPNCKNRYINMQKLDDIIFDEIRKLAVDPEYLAELKDTAQGQNQAPIIEKEIATLDKQIAKLMDLYSVGNMPLDLLQERISSLNDQRSNLTSELDRILQAESEKLTKKETLKIVSGFSDVLDRGSFSEIREMLGALIDKIVIWPDDIDIYWNFV